MLTLCPHFVHSRYSMESILVHEFGHTVMNVGLDESTRLSIVAAWSAAMREGMYSPGRQGRGVDGCWGWRWACLLDLGLRSGHVLTLSASADAQTTHATS